MGEVKNLTSLEAIAKIKELAEAADMCFFVTNLATLPLSGRPMSTQEVDDDGNIWFMSRNDSNKNFDIENDSSVQLFYSNNGKYEYLSVYGTATILVDKDKIEDLWKPIAKAWFTEGKDDPSITLIKVKPEHAYYWDTKYNKLVSLINMVVSTITGKESDGGIEGEIIP